MPGHVSGAVVKTSVWSVDDDARLLTTVEATGPRGDEKSWSTTVEGAYAATYR